ncbi:MAG: hypothetical protein LBK45_05075 [Tannerellaceae bacterium]|jgi:hypothetical protein|nr:hypothetical protein [Tannerellaceae bacterium]
MKYFIVIICFSLICSCVNEQTNINENTTPAEVIDNLIGKAVDLPDSLLLVSYHTVDSHKHDSGSPDVLKLVTFIDAGYSDCRYKLNFWKKFLSSVYAANKNCIFYLYINWGNEKIDSLSNPIYQKFNFPYAWYLDTNDLFFNKYGITDKKMQTMLLNGRNEILLVGDPVFDTALCELYFNRIAQ